MIDDEVWARLGTLVGIQVWIRQNLGLDIFTKLLKNRFQGRNRLKTCLSVHDFVISKTTGTDITRVGKGLHDHLAASLIVVKWVDDGPIRFQ